MAKALPEIIYTENNVTPIIDANTSFYTLPYYKDLDYFSNYESYVNFVKGVEKSLVVNCVPVVLLFPDLTLIETFQIDALALASQKHIEVPPARLGALPKFNPW